MSSPALAAADLQPVVAGVVGGTIRSLRRLSGGAGRQTWAVGTDEGDELVVQIARSGTDDHVLDVVRQAEVIERSRVEGTPVPMVRLAARGTPLGDVLVSERVPGETIARRILRDEEFATARATLIADLGRALASIHSAPLAALPPLDDLEPLATWRARLDDLGRTTPTLEYAFRWLDRHRPEAARRTLVHGDFRLGNLIVDRFGLAAVIDWELAHVGDPVEDLGWLCVRSWRFGGPSPVAGIGSRRGLLDAYAAHGGEPVDPAALRWWEVFGSLRWGIICMTQLDAHETGQERSVELATIGRRVSEVDHDLLLLLS